MLDGNQIAIRALGRRIERLRAGRGLTQADLGAAVGLSKGYVSELERGEKSGLPISRFLSLVEALDARVEIVSTTEDDPVQEQDSKLILNFRRLLLARASFGSPSMDEVELTYATLRERVMRSTADFNKARYVKLAAELPDVIIAIEAAISLHEGEAKEALNRLLAHANILTAQTLITLRNEDLACQAVGNAMDAAEKTGDPVLRAVAAENYSWAFRRQGLFDAAETVAVDMAAQLEPSMMKPAPEHLAAWGRLLRKASKAAAYRNRPDVARDLLSIAHSAAVRMGGGSMDYERYWTLLSPTMIGITRTEIAFIEGDAALTLQTGKEVRWSENIHLDMWTWHLVVMANAQTSTRDYDGAIKTLKETRKIAPEWIKNSRGAHNVAITLLGKVTARRARDSGLAELATFMGVQP